MINVGNFYALARAQLDRAIGDECRDAVLAKILRADHHPTRPSRVRQLMDSFARPADRVRMAAACAWFGMAQPELALIAQEDDPTMEARARLVDAGAVTAPADAPCRTWPWAAVVRALSYDRRTTQLVHGRFEGILGPYVDAFIADVRHLLIEPEDGPWVRVTREEADGLAWVATDVTDGGPQESRVVLRHLAEAAREHWPSVKLVDPWTIDSLARWAGRCAQYVEASRRTRG